MSCPRRLKVSGCAEKQNVKQLQISHCLIYNKRTQHTHTQKKKATWFPENCTIISTWKIVPCKYISDLDSDEVFTAEPTARGPAASEIILTPEHQPKK